MGDIEGDRKGGIDTFASRLGPAKVARGASAVLLLNYIGAIATALLAPAGAFRRAFMAGGHALGAAWLVVSSAKLQPDSASSLKSYYKQVWNLFYFGEGRARTRRAPRVRALLAADGAASLVSRRRSQSTSCIPSSDHARTTRARQLR